MTLERRHLHNWTCMHVGVYHMQASVFSYVAIHGSIYDVIIWTQHYQIINYHIVGTRHQFTLWVIYMTADSLKLRHLTIGFPLHGWINNYNGIYSSWWCHTYMCKYCLFVCMYTTWQCMCTCMFQYWKFLWYRLSWHLIPWLHGNIIISPNPKVVIPIDYLP